jgi:ferric-dicitrate binding protein FerR (iron transport regulator)
MNYREYTYIEFLRDDYFVQWVLKPNNESELFWKNWLELEPPNKTEMLKARRMIEAVGYQHYHPIEKGDMQQLHENIIRFSQLQSFERSAPRRSITAAYWMAAAVVFLLVSTAGLIFWMNSSSAPLPAEISFHTTETIPGLKQTLKLPDGTLVKLNSESTITYPAEFVGDERVVELQGEAFFEVVENEAKPFVVKSRGFETRVLGTSFNIQNYPGEIQKVAVLTGLVKVTSDKGKSTLVEPEQMLTLKGSEALFEITAFDYRKEIGWKDGILHFENETLKEVFAVLERWYGVDIECNNPELLNDIYDGEFRNETLKNVLDGIGYTSGYSYQEKKGVYWIY